MQPKFLLLLSLVCSVTMLAVYRMDTLESKSITDVLTEKVIRICPFCTDNAGLKQTSSLNSENGPIRVAHGQQLSSVGQENDAAAIQELPYQDGQQLSSVDQKNDAAIIQQLPYKVSGVVDVPQPTSQVISYNLNPAIAIRFAQVQHCSIHNCVLHKILDETNQSRAMSSAPQGTRRSYLRPFCEMRRHVMPANPRLPRKPADLP